MACRLADPVDGLFRCLSLDLLFSVDVVEHYTLLLFLPKLVRLIPDEYEGQPDENGRYAGNLRLNGYSINTIEG